MPRESEHPAFTALLVEGTSGIGKSTLIDALIRRHLQQRPQRKIRTLLHLAQTHTYGPLARAEDARTLTVEQNQQHLERIAAMLEWLHAGAQEHAKPLCFAILDTLHLTHCVRPGVVNWVDVAAFDQRLASIGCKLLFLQASPQTIWQRGINARADEQFIREYALKFGRTLEEIHQYFVCEQETLTQLMAKSAIPKLTIQVEDPPETYLDEAFDFWHQSN